MKKTTFKLREVNSPMKCWKTYKQVGYKKKGSAMLLKTKKSMAMMKKKSALMMKRMTAAAAKMKMKKK